MAIEFYWGSGSPFAWRAMLTLEVKGLPYESKLLEFSKREHKTPAYLRLNPRGKVPTLKDGEFVVYESLAIMAYLERKYPNPALFGKTAEETGAIWRAISENESYLAGAADKIVRPVFFGKGLDKVDEILEAANSVREELRGMDTTLQRKDWLIGDAMSAADLAAFPFVQLLLRAASKEAAKPLNLGLMPLDEHFPSIGKWCQRIEAIPNYQKTYPPHWR